MDFDIGYAYDLRSMSSRFVINFVSFRAKFIALILDLLTYQPNLGFTGYVICVLLQKLVVETRWSWGQSFNLLNVSPSNCCLCL